MIIAGESIPSEMETTFRKCQSDTYIVYCPIIFDRLVKSSDTDPLLMVHIGPKMLTPFENMALVGSKEEASNRERERESGET